MAVQRPTEEGMLLTDILDELIDSSGKSRSSERTNRALRELHSKVLHALRVEGIKESDSARVVELARVLDQASRLEQTLGIEGVLTGLVASVMAATRALQHDPVMTEYLTKSHSSIIEIDNQVDDQSRGVAVVAALVSLASGVALLTLGQDTEPSPELQEDGSPTLESMLQRLRGGMS